MSKSKVKNLYIGRYQGRIKSYIERCMAFSEKQAHVVLCNRIAKKQGAEAWMVLKFFKENPERYSVKTEIEFEEVSDNDNLAVGR